MIASLCRLSSSGRFTGLLHAGLRRPVGFFNDAAQFFCMIRERLCLGAQEMHRYVTAMQKGDPDNSTVWVGEATGLIHDVRPAGEIIQEIVGDAERLLGDKAPSIVRTA